MSTEEWREAPGFPGYMVSSDGRIAKVLTAKPGKQLPYRQIGVPIERGSKKRKREYVHRIVAAAFLGECPEGCVVRHLNDDPADNRVKNLAYGTCSENQADAFRNGKRIKREVCRWGHKLQAPNLTGDGTHCLACNRARAFARGHKITLTRELRDEYYAEVMS